MVGQSCAVQGGAQDLPVLKVLQEQKLFPSLVATASHVFMRWDSD